jgi:hypothetical protein
MRLYQFFLIFYFQHLILEIFSFQLRLRTTGILHFKTPLHFRQSLVLSHSLSLHLGLASFHYLQARLEATVVYMQDKQTDERLRSHTGI